MNRKQRRAGRKIGGRTGAHAAGRAAQVRPMFVEAVRRRQYGFLAEAEALCREILAVDPDHADSLHLLGNLALHGGRPDRAVEWMGRAIAIDDGVVAYHEDLGLALHALGRSEEAVAELRQAVRLAPDNGGNHNNLAVVLLAQGRRAEASAAFARALAVTPEQFDEKYQDACATLCKVIPALPEALARAADAWPRRLSLEELFGSAGFAAFADDALLRCMLVSATVRDVALERLLTNVRGALLERAADATAETDVLGFCCALARQCFINEYVFATTPEEAAAAERLKQSLAEAVMKKSAAEPLPVALAGCYFALAALPDVDELLERPWPAALDAVLTQQLREPREERRLRETIPRLTPIEDATSVQVRQQYEENPYPRWVLAPPRRAPAPLDGYFRQRFPFAPFRALGKTDVDILIAGCGTGQHPIGMAQRFAGARLLAVDLSLASLGYALRKTRELGLDNIAYAQADILKLGSLGRTFDLIDTRGVLHHLADPAAGWRVLLSLLRPSGLMAVGLYSELARRDVVAARAFCAERGYRPTGPGIRECRQALLSGEFRSFEQFNDFFSVSECRDMLFHVEEHRFTIAEIGALLDALGLRLIGFELPAPVAAAYRQRFPDDPGMLRLEYWGKFESERPGTFAAMYQFWAQKA